VSDLRIGLGVDAHAFSERIPLVLGGVTIDHPRGLAGHSDGDVLLRGGTHRSRTAPLLPARAWLDRRWAPAGQSPAPPATLCARGNTVEGR
jgi:hypothetical protein